MLERHEGRGRGNKTGKAALRGQKRAPEGQCYRPMSTREVAFSELTCKNSIKDSCKSNSWIYLVLFPTYKIKYTAFLALNIADVY